MKFAGVISYINIYLVGWSEHWGLSEVTLDGIMQAYKDQWFSSFDLMLFFFPFSWFVIYGWSKANLEHLSWELRLKGWHQQVYIIRHVVLGWVGDTHPGTRFFESVS